MLNQNIYKGSLCTYALHIFFENCKQDDILSNSQFVSFEIM